MKPVNRLYLRMFLISGLSFASGMAIFDFVWGSGPELLRFLFHFLFFGGCMALLLVGLHRWQLKKQGMPNTDALSVVQAREVKTSHSRDEVAGLLKLDPAFRHMSITSDGDALKLTTGTTWRSWGEIILLNFRQDRNDGCVVEIRSKPWLGTTVVDYGKNKENVERIAELIG